MALAKVPALRRVSVVSIITTVSLLVLGAIFPQMTLALAFLAIMVYSLPYIIFVYVWPKRGERNVSRDISVRELTPEAVRSWYEAGRLTREEYEKMLRGLEDD